MASRKQLVRDLMQNQLNQTLASPHTELRTIKISFYLNSVTWALLFFSIFSLAGRWLWGAELASHFKWQYFLLSLGLCFVFLWVRNFKYVALNFVILFINVYDIAPLFSQNEISIKSHQELNLTIVQFNRYIDNLQNHKIIQWLSNKENKFDIILIHEINSKFVQDLKNLDTIYPHQYITPYKGNFGQALLSKKEIIKVRLKPSFDKASSYLTADILLSKTHNLKLYGIHAMSPETPKSATMRNEQLDRIAKSISNDPSKTKIAMGDFNVTPYSYYFSRFEKTMGLKNTMKGFGPQNSWPSLSPLAIFRIPIDHIFVSKNVRVVDRIIGDNFGSDHFPVILKLSL